MSINIIGIAPISAVANVNAVLEAMGRGPGSLTRNLTTAADPAWDATPTHMFMSDQGVSSEFQADLLAAAGGDLPPLAEGYMWGEDGVISAADAAAAMAQFAVASFNDGFAPTQQLAAAIAAHDPVLYVIPQPEY